MILEKVDRRDGIVAETFEVGSSAYLMETARAAKLLFSETGFQVRRDFRAELEKGREYATVGFLYRVRQ